MHRRRPSRLLLLVLAVALVAAGCSKSRKTEEAARKRAGSCARGDVVTVAEDKLTIGTDTPALPPWFEDDDPSNGKGFESAVAYVIADELDFAKDEVVWTTVPFGQAVGPGEKDFDFAIDQVAISEEREEDVDFSYGYYDVNQAIIGYADSSASEAETVADLKGLKLGAQEETTSLDFVTDVIAPDQEPFVYDDDNEAKVALNAEQVDGLVVDLPTALDASAAGLEGAEVFGQFPPEGDDVEQFGMVFEEGNRLRDCVNFILAALMNDGTLAEIQETYLADAVAPEITVE
jgi:polar amino acid transport system substrate-binding protein